MLVNPFRFIHNIGSDVDRTPDQVAPGVKTSANTQRPSASAGTRANGAAQATMQRALWMVAPRAASVDQEPKGASWTNARNFHGQQRNGQRFLFKEKIINDAVNAAMRGFPTLKKNETLALAINERLYKQSDIPRKLEASIVAANQLDTDIKKDLAAVKRQAAAMLLDARNRLVTGVPRNNVSGSTLVIRSPRHPFPYVHPSLYSAVTAHDENPRATGIRMPPVVNGRELRSRHLQGNFRSFPIHEFSQALPPITGRDGHPESARRHPGGASASTSMSADDYVALSDKELNELAPFLFKDDRIPQNPTAHAAEPISAHADDYVALSDKELDELAPFLFKDDHISQNLTAHAPQPTSVHADDYTTLSDDELASLLPFIGDNSTDEIPRPQAFNAISLPAMLTDGQREEAELLIPEAILDQDLLGSAAQYDPEQRALVEGKWRHAMQLLVYYRDNPMHDPVAEETDLMAQRQRAASPPVGRLDENFNWSHVTLRDTPGGGDCLVHALEEGMTSEKQSLKHILQTRQEIAAMRSANPEDPKGNRNALVASLQDVAPRPEEELQWKDIVPKDAVSNQLFAAFQACPGVYSGTDMIVQWTMLGRNKDKTVIAIDTGFVARTSGVPNDPGVTILPDVMAYRNGQRIPFEEKLTNEKLNDLLAQGCIVIRNKDQHWQSVCGPS